MNCVTRKKWRDVQIARVYRDNLNLRYVHN